MSSKTFCWFRRAVHSDIGGLTHDTKSDDGCICTLVGNKFEKGSIGGECNSLSWILNIFYLFFTFITRFIWRPTCFTWWGLISFLLIFYFWICRIIFCCRVYSGVTRVIGELNSFRKRENKIITLIFTMKTRKKTLRTRKILLECFKPKIFSNTPIMELGFTACHRTADSSH